MRHRVAHRKLGRVTEHRISMLRNQATALLRHEHVTTTVPKAKELRPFVERIITHVMGFDAGLHRDVVGRCFGGLEWVCVDQLCVTHWYKLQCRLRR